MEKKRIYIEIIKKKMRKVMQEIKRSRDSKREIERNLKTEYIKYFFYFQ